MRSRLLLRLVFVAVLGAVCLSVGAAAGAQAALVRVALGGAEDETLLSRVLGQTADLPLRLEPLRLAVPAGVSACEGAAGAAEGALLCFRHQPGGATQVVLRRGAGVTERWVEAPRSLSAAARSAHREEVAVLVRALLRLAPAAPVLAEAPPPLPPPAGPGRVLSPWRFAGALGWSLAFDGTRPGQQGPWLQLGGRYQRGPATLLQLAVTALTAVPGRLDDAYTAIALGRQAVGIEAIARRGLSPRWLAGVGVLAAAAFYDRRTSVVDARVQGAPPALLPAFLLSPSVRGGARLSRGWLLELTAALDVVAGAPVLLYDRGSDTLVRATPWPVQPRLALGLLWLPAGPQ